MFIDGIELSALDWIKKDFGGFLDTFEKAVVLSASSSSLLIWVMSKNLLAVSALDLVFGSFVSVFRETKDGVVILLLRKC